MENEENLEVQAEKAPKLTRPKKRVRSSGFGAEEVTQSPIVDPAPQSTEPDVEEAPEPVAEEVVHTPDPEPVVAPPAPAPPAPAKAPEAPAAPAPARGRKTRVARPLRNQPDSGTQRGIRTRR